MHAHILVVNHDKSESAEIASMLALKDVTITLVHDQEKALEVIENDTPDIVCLSTNLDGHKGFELLKYIRTVYSSQDIPVVMLGDSFKADEVVQALELGANDYLAKPFVNKILVAKIISIIENARNLRDALERNEMELINVLVARYNHELNNPLAIAIGFVKKAKKEQSLEYFDRINDSLQRMSEIVREIGRVTKKKSASSNDDTTRKFCKIHFE